MSATWDSKSLKATPTTNDEILIIDTEDSRNQKRATLASFGWSRNAGSGLLFPTNLTDDIGLGKNDPAEKLDVLGNIVASGTITANQMALVNQGTGANPILFSNSDTNLATFDGDVEAGTLKSVSNAIGGSVNPIEVGEVLNIVLAGAQRFAVAAGFAVVPSPTDSSVSVLDVSDQLNPTILTTFSQIGITAPFAVVCQSDRAFISSDEGIFTLDISDKSNPVALSPSLVLNTKIKDLVLQGNQLFGYNELTARLESYTVTLQGTFLTTGFLALGRTVNKLFVHEGFIYATSVTGGGIFIIDIKNAKTPILHKDFTDATFLPVTHDVAVVGRFMYITTDDGMEVYDITDKINPVRVGAFNDGLVHQALQISTDFAYLSNTVKVIDIRDPTNPVFQGGLADDHADMLLVGKRIFALDLGKDEFDIYDVSGALLDTARIGTLHVSSIDVADSLNVSDRVTIGDILSVGRGGIHCLGDVSAQHFHINNDNELHWNNFAGTATKYIKFNVNDELETDSKDFVISPPTGETPRVRLLRNFILPNLSIIGSIRARTLNSLSEEKTFAELKFFMENDVSENGSIVLTALSDSFATDFLRINDQANNRVDILRELDINTNKIIRVVDPTSPQDVTTKNYTDTAPRIQDLDFAQFDAINIKSLVNSVADVVEVVAKDFKINKTGTSQQMFFQREEILNNNQTIGLIRAESQDAGGTLRPFARIRLRMMESAVGNDSGSMEFNTRFNGSNKDWIYINDLANGKIQFFGDLDMEGNDFVDRDVAIVHTANLPRFKIDRPALLSSGNTIGLFRVSSWNSNNSLINYGQIAVTMEDSSAGVEYGGFKLQLERNGSLDTFLQANIGSSNTVQILKDLDMSGNEITNAILENKSDNYIYVKTPDDFGPLLTLSNITAFTDIGGGEIQCASLTHGLVTGNVVQFSGTPYDTGTHEIIRVDANNFKFTETFTTTGTGTWTAKKRQVYKSGLPSEKIFYYLLNDVSLDAPLLLTPPSTETPQYSFFADVSGFAQLSFDYATTLGAAYQGEEIESLNRTGINAIMSSGLQTASVRVLDVGFITSGFSFYVDDAITDIGAGIHVRDANAVTLKNNSFYLTHTLGHKFTNCVTVDTESISHSPIATMTTPIIEVVETTRSCQATFSIQKMDNIATGVDAFKIPSTIDVDSRYQFLDCRVPDDADLFDATGLDGTDPQVLARGNVGHADSVTTGEFDFLNIATPRLVTIVSTNTPVAIAGGAWTSSSLERVTADGGNNGIATITALGTNVYTVSFSALLEKLTGGATNIVLTVLVNGTDTTVNPPHSVNAGIIQISGTRLFSLSENDTLQLAVYNVTSTNNIEVSQATMSITRGA